MFRCPLLEAGLDLPLDALVVAGKVKGRAEVGLKLRLETIGAKV